MQSILSENKETCRDETAPGFRNDKLSYLGGIYPGGGEILNSNLREIKQINTKNY